MHKALILAAVVAAFSSVPAQAQDYSRSAQRAALAMETCRFVGDAAAMAFMAKQQGKPLVSVATDGTFGSIIRWAEDFGGNQAGDIRQAARMGFAKCLDNFDLMHQDMRARRTTPVGELN